jgi:hypothetical protein
MIDAGIARIDNSFRVSVKTGSAFFELAKIMASSVGNIRAENLFGFCFNDYLGFQAVTLFLSRVVAFLRVSAISDGLFFSDAE